MYKYEIEKYLFAFGFRIDFVGFNQLIDLIYLINNDLENINYDYSSINLSYYYDILAYQYLIKPDTIKKNISTLIKKCILNKSNLFNYYFGSLDKISNAAVINQIIYIINQYKD